MISHHTSRTRHGAFTIVELMVVLAIGTIVAAITVGGFKSVSENNRKTTCQANLAQIYLAGRQYAQDSDGRFPYLNGGADLDGDGDVENIPNGASNNAPLGGFGLWTLYAFTPNNGADQNCETGVVDNTNDPFPEPESTLGRLTGYARAIKIFHCPSDRFSATVKYSTDNCATAPREKQLTSGEPIFTVDEGTATPKKLVNPLFMSYQSLDDVSGVQTYSVFRQAYRATTDATVIDPTGRQLQPFIPTPSTNPTDIKIVKRVPDATTVITWCRFHRSLRDRNTTNDGKRNFDNVLFYDGSIQFLPTRANDNDANRSVSTGGRTGWKRLPRGEKR